MASVAAAPPRNPGDSRLWLARMLANYAWSRKTLTEAKELSAEDRFEHLRFQKRAKKLLKEHGIDADGEYRQRLAELIDTPPTRLTHGRTAMLVVHGIGEQNPYETLDQFARNLTRYLKFEGGVRDLALSGHKINHNDEVETMVRLETAAHQPEDSDEPAIIDLYEYYWAPATEGKISYRQTLDWLVKTTLTPFRYFQANKEAIAQAEQKGHADPTARARVAGREVGRMIKIYLPVLLFVTLLSVWLPQATQLGTAFTEFKKEWSDQWQLRTMASVFFALAALMTWFSLTDVASRVLRWARGLSSLRDSTSIVMQMSIAVASGAIGWYLLYRFGRDLAWYAKPFLHWELLAAGASLGMAKVFQSFLADFLGDVALYANSSARAASFEIRKKILLGSTTAMLRILNSEVGYDQVVLAGHSLGSVIAYDTINEISNRMTDNSAQGAVAGVNVPPLACTDAQLQTVKGLVTFGSPLDKIYYFFREFIPKEQRVRAQVVNFMNFFRKSPSGSNYGIYKFTQYNPIGPALTWYNAYSPQDPVSGRLVFFQPDESRAFEYNIPVYAHLSYWEDVRFYEFFASPLLLGMRVPAQTVAEEQRQDAMGSSGAGGVAFAPGMQPAMPRASWWSKAMEFVKAM